MTELMELDDCVFELTLTRRGSLPRRLWRWLTRRPPEWTLRVELIAGPDRGDEWWAEMRLLVVRMAIDAGARVSRVREG